MEKKPSNDVEKGQDLISVATFSLSQPSRDSPFAPLFCPTTTHGEAGARRIFRARVSSSSFSVVEKAARDQRAIYLGRESEKCAENVNRSRNVS